ncbi:uncharacterized protein LOC124157508 [Ischnura elegans]|uniref:uncharacterized protein LOC124157508 n=1 Tax=Ischnura elegans TaxID=197161 RepID=UPI001ED87DF2|nr:uncharacterized protein LOC124157508 [Ischnura elegans]XP_046388257.1 uncharacterized protein LOC124157508 [Ischnura elegans]
MTELLQHPGPHLAAFGSSLELRSSSNCQPMVATGSSSNLLLGHSPPLASPSSDMATKDPLKHSKSSDALLEGPYYDSVGRCGMSTGRDIKEADESSGPVFPFRKNASEDSVLVVGLSRDERHPRGSGRSLHGGDVGVQGSHYRTERRHRSRGHLDDLGRSSSSRRPLGLCDRVDPEDSIKDMVIENDFYRYVLFKRHYEKYVSLSKKYEEAKNMVYYLEEKYHEVKTELDELRETRRDLEYRLEHTEIEMHDKEEELFLQLEKVVRLEEECEKLKREAAASEATRRKLEAARWDVIKQMSVVAAERDSLEKENELLRGSLSEERKELGHYLIGMDHQRSTFSRKVVGLEKKVTELQFAARQSASLNSHLKKGMKHLASCKKRKCSVCHYTRSMFGEYDEGNRSKLFSCIQSPLQEVKNWIVRPISRSESTCSGERTRKGSEGSMTSEDEGGRATPSASSPFSITPSASIGCLLHSTAIDASSPSPQALEPAHLLSSLPLTYCSCQSYCEGVVGGGSPHRCCPLHNPEHQHSPTIDISFIDDSCASVEGVPTNVESKDIRSGAEGGENDGHSTHLANGSLPARVISSYDAAASSTSMQSDALNSKKGELGGNAPLPISPRNGSASMKQDAIAISFSCSSPQMCSPCLPLMVDNSQASMSPSESEPPRPSTKSSGVLSSDSGFSSEMCESAYCPRVAPSAGSNSERRSDKNGKGDGSAKESADVSSASSGGFTRSKWTTSFRKLIHRVSKK